MQFYRSLPATLAVLSLLGCVLFAKYYLGQSSTQFIEDFERQNFAELSKGDSFALTQRLNALSTSVHWKCMIGTRKGQVFFEKKSDDCSENFLSKKVATSTHNGQDIEVVFVLSLPDELVTAGISFIFLQSLLLMSLSITSRTSERFKLKTQAELGRLAEQVAHDIRSPLAALEVIVQRTESLPPDERLLIRNATFRIRDIANNLLKKNRPNTPIQSMTSLGTELFSNEPLSPQLCSSLVDQLISEKRMQFRSKAGINISYHMTAPVYGLFASIQPTEFQRILSNIINNSVEALDDHGFIDVLLTKSDSGPIVMVTDNGKGIPVEHQSKLGQRGATFGKAGGTGLGLYHARLVLEGWGGKLLITSTPQKGTIVTLELPAAETPDWFVSSIQLKPNSCVIILDDDHSIHQAWISRLESAKIHFENMSRPINIYHFYNLTDFKIWRSNSRAPEPSIYLCDYDLQDDSETGLDLIEALGLQMQSILVTSRFMESSVRERCSQQGLKLIPKTLLGYVPINCLT